MVDNRKLDNILGVRVAVAIILVFYLGSIHSLTYLVDITSIFDFDSNNSQHFTKKHIQ